MEEKSPFVSLFGKLFRDKAGHLGTSLLSKWTLEYD